VPNVKEFDNNWGAERRIAVWEDGRRIFRVENVVQPYGVVKAFDIDPIPRPCYTPTATLVTSSSIEVVKYGGWTDNTYLHILPAGDESGKVSISATIVEQLDGVTYNVNLKSSTSTRGLPERLAMTTYENVRITTWNCRGIPRATFTPNLLTLRSMTQATIVLLTETRTSGMNAREILSEAHGLNYFYTPTLGFVGGVAVLWDKAKVFLYGFRSEGNHVSFRVKVMILLQQFLLIMKCVTSPSSLQSHSQHIVVTYAGSGIMAGDVYMRRTTAYSDIILCNHFPP